MILLSLLISSSVSILDILCGGRIFVKANSKDPAVRKMFTKQILVKAIIKNKLEELKMSEQGKNLLFNVKKWNNISLFKKGNLFMYGMLQFDPRHRFSIEKAAGHPVRLSFLTNIYILNVILVDNGAENG